MKHFYLIAALVALSGCSAHDVESDLDACKAESLKTTVPPGEKLAFQMNCMGGKGYTYIYTDACLRRRSELGVFSDCFESRGLIRDTKRFFSKYLKN